MKTNESVIPPPFGRIPIVITKSNMSFVEVGEHTHINDARKTVYLVIFL